MAKIKQATKKTGRARKEQIVTELVEKIDKASGLVFADYKGLTHKQLESLKKELKQLDSTIVIAKNSLIKLSLEKSKNFADYKDNEGLDLPTATLFIGGDMVEPLKKVQKTIKEFGLPKIKFAILDGALTDEAGVLKIASLPNREMLLAQLVGMLNSPISGLVVTLNGTIQKFVMTLDAVARLPRPASPHAKQSEAAREPSDGGQAKAKPASAPAPAPSDPSTTQTEKPQPEASSEEPAASGAELVEPAAPANPPAEQSPAPVETDENIESAEPTSEIEQAIKTEDEKTKGGEN